jgi:hypothetical protein
LNTILFEDYVLGRNLAFILPETNFLHRDEKVLKQKELVENESDFAERCRKALEKSFGMEVPMPSCTSKKRYRF